jgi:hypothetical protein
MNENIFFWDSENNFTDYEYFVLRVLDLGRLMRKILSVIFYIKIYFLKIKTGALGMVYVSQPLDTVKVKMQTFPKLYTGMVSCFVTTFKRDGVVRGLYAGNGRHLLINDEF